MNIGEAQAVVTVSRALLDDGRPAPDEHKVREALLFLAERTQKARGAGIHPNIVGLLALRAPAKTQAEIRAERERLVDEEGEAQQENDEFGDVDTHRRLCELQGQIDALGWVLT